jgi:hypothetical protein
MTLVILHHLLNVSVQLANKRGFKQKKAADLNSVTKETQLAINLYTINCCLLNNEVRATGGTELEVLCKKN